MAEQQMLRSNQSEPIEPPNSYREISGKKYQYHNYEPIPEEEACLTVEGYLSKKSQFTDARKYKVKDDKGNVVGYRVYFTKQ